MYRKWGLPAIILLNDWLNKVVQAKKKIRPKADANPFKGRIMGNMKGRKRD